MKLLDLIRRDSDANLLWLGVLASVSGIANALLLVIINMAAQDASDQAASFRDLALFLVSIALYALTQRQVMVSSTREVESMIHRIRDRLMEKIRRADLLPLERVGRSSIYASLNKDTQTLSQTAQSLVVGVQSAILTVFTLLYIAWLSRIAFLVSLGIVVLAIALYLRKLKRLNAELQEAAAEENRLFDLLTDLLEGFKEVRMNTRRSDEIYSDLSAMSLHASEKKQESQSGIARNFIFSQLMFYLLVASMVFLVPRMAAMMHSKVAAYPEVVVQISTATLFLLGPVSFLINFLPMLANANSAADNIELLDQTLSKAAGASAGASKQPLKREFGSLRLEGIRFHYSDPKAERPFTLGPIDFSIQQGELLFVTGGNGSGKSTMIKILAGLYYPTVGSVRVDGRVIGEETYDAYRNMFATVFSDFHLFKRLYGVGDADPERIRTLLEWLELENKTEVVDGEFTTVDLSGGQRKRVGLAVALLEDKPIYILDEWAADQDPEFRRKFYREILPEMKRQGKTVIAVTHDDHYFDVCDRRVHLAEGQIGFEES